jgi:hypothetical protein
LLNATDFKFSGVKTMQWDVCQVSKIVRHVGQKLLCLQVDNCEHDRNIQQFQGLL